MNNFLYDSALSKPVDSVLVFNSNPEDDVNELDSQNDRQG